MTIASFLAACRKCNVKKCNHARMENPEEHHFFPVVQYSCKDSVHIYCTQLTKNQVCLNFFV